jgi:hypothetical protein
LQTYRTEGLREELIEFYGWSTDYQPTNEEINRIINEYLKYPIR